MTTAARRIAVGVDGSRSAADALRWAAEAAEPDRATLTAVMAWGFLSPDHAAALPGVEPPHDEQGALAALTGHTTAAVGRASAPHVRVTAICDRPAHALVTAASEADLLVIGARRPAGRKERPLGLIVRHCLQHSPVPVAVVRSVNHTGPIVVAVDDSPAALRALRWAGEEAARRNTPLHVVHAWQFPTRYDPQLLAVLELRDLERTARRDLDQIVASADITDVDLRVHLARGTPSAAICSMAAGAELIVMGTRGRGPFSRVLLGSTTTEVVRRAGSPVVVIPDR